MLTKQLMARDIGLVSRHSMQFQVWDAERCLDSDSLATFAKIVQLTLANKGIKTRKTRNIRRKMEQKYLR